MAERKVQFKTERPIAFFDLECYRNFFYVAFLTEDGRSAFYERSDRADFDGRRIRRILKKYTVVGFNSRDYDLMVLLYALGGATNEQLKKLSDWIIQKRKSPGTVSASTELLFRALSITWICLIQIRLSVPARTTMMRPKTRSLQVVRA